MIARYRAWMAHTPTWWLTTLGVALVLVWLVLDFVAVMIERPDNAAWIIGGAGMGCLALGNLLPLTISSHGGAGSGEQDRSHWRGMAQACFGVIVIATQVLPGGPVPYAIMACAAWICFLSVLAFALHWRWPLRADAGDRVHA